MFVELNYYESRRPFMFNANELVLVSPPVNCSKAGAWLYFKGNDDECVETLQTYDEIKNILVDVPCTGTQKF